MRKANLLISILFGVALPFTTAAQTKGPAGPQRVSPVRRALTKTTAFFKARHQDTVNVALGTGTEGKVARGAATAAGLLGIASIAAAFGLSPQEVDPVNLTKGLVLISASSTLAPAAAAHRGWRGDGSPREGRGARAARGITHTFALMADPMVALAVSMGRPLEKLFDKVAR